MKLSPSNVFYSRFADTYQDYSRAREVYLRSVDAYIQSDSLNARNLIDVGAGDGRRGKRISDMLGIKLPTLLDNSEGMIRILELIPGVRVLGADISHPNFSHGETYQAVVCLWNVLGHMSLQGRGTTLKNLSRLVSDDGSIYIDVNNRYNAAHYGIWPALKNVLKDLFALGKRRGDFTFGVETADGGLFTEVHIFSPFEIEKLFKKAGLKVVERRIIDYRTGKRRRAFWNGQLMYKLKKA